MSKTLNMVYVVLDNNKNIVAIHKSMDKILRKIYDIFENNGYYYFKMESYDDDWEEVVFFKRGSMCGDSFEIKRIKVED